MSTIRITDTDRADDARLLLVTMGIDVEEAADGLDVPSRDIARALRVLDSEGFGASAVESITRIDDTTAHDAETGARIHRTPRGWWVAVATGPQPTDAVRVGEGADPAAAVATLSGTAIQSVGADCGEAEALEWVSWQLGAGYTYSRDEDGWEIGDRD